MRGCQLSWEQARLPNLVARGDSAVEISELELHGAGRRCADGFKAIPWKLFKAVRAVGKAQVDLGYLMREASDVQLAVQQASSMST